MYVIFASPNHFVICVSSSKHPITLLQNYLLSNSYHTSFVLHFWILNMGVLIIQKKCFLKSFLKPDWRACWYCSNISRAQLPETQHMSPNLPQQPQGFGGFHTKFFCIFTQKTITLHSYNWTASYHLVWKEDKVCRVVNLEDAFPSQPSIKTSSPHAWPIFEEEPQFRRKGSIFSWAYCWDSQGQNREWDCYWVKPKDNRWEGMCHCLFAR